MPCSWAEGREEREEKEKEEKEEKEKVKEKQARSLSGGREAEESICGRETGTEAYYGGYRGDFAEVYAETETERVREAVLEDCGG